MGFEDLTFENFNWGPGLFLIIYHIMALVLAPYYFLNFAVPSFFWWGLLVLFVFSMLSITTGYHRYYSHRSYKPNKVAEPFLLFFGTLCAEGSVLDWAHDHRLHHRHVDTGKDPYNIEKGFWDAHFIWMFRSRERNHKKVVPDLLKNKLLTFQHRHYGTLMMTANALVGLMGGWVTGDYFGAFTILVLLRMFLGHHSTWFINSLAHTWGVKPYSKELSAVNNYFISFLTMGEGYHNYHHVFAGDYRNGIKWWQFDPGKWLVWLLSKLGLTEKVTKVNEYTIKKKLIKEDKRLMMKALDSVSESKKNVIEKINEMHSALVSYLNQLKKLADDYKKEKDKAVKKKMKNVKKSFRKEWKSWQELCDNVLELNPHMH